MTTIKEYTYQEEEEKLESLLNDTTSCYKNTVFEKQVRLLNNCFIHLLDYDYLIPEEKADAIHILDTIEHHVKDLYRLYRAAKDEGFYVRTLSQKTILNPYCKEKKSEDEFLEMTLKLFDGKIRHLHYKELFNIYIFLDRLFEAKSILSWLDHIKVWKIEISKECRHIRDNDVYRPTWTFFHFHQILEAHYIVVDCGLGYDSNIPTIHHQNHNTVIFSEIECLINPFEYLECQLFDKPIGIVKDLLKNLFQVAKNEISMETTTPLNLIDIETYLKVLLETAYLICKTPYIPEEWIKLDNWSRFSGYKRPQIEEITYEYLSKKEIKNPYKVLKKELPSISSMHYQLNEWLEGALAPNYAKIDTNDNFTKINKIIEAIYIIYYDLLSKEQIAIEDKNRIEITKCDNIE